jgi:hypothetical protein
MKSIDMSKRWIYKGSLTIPPCERFVLWNVIHKVYPISQETVDLIQVKLKKGGVKKVLDFDGNWRNTQKGYNKDVAYIMSRASSLFGFSCFALILSKILLI